MERDSHNAGTGPSGHSILAIARFVDHDSKPDTNPDSKFWADASSVVAANDNLGNPIPGHETKILIRRPFLASVGLHQGGSPSRCATSSVSRPAGLLKLNLRG